MVDLGTRTLSTQRLLLRRFNMVDVKDMYYGWGSDEKVTKFLTWEAHPTMEVTERLVKQWIKDYEVGSYNWVIEEQKSKQIIGNISCVKMDRVENSCEIGYCFGSKYWGNGYATEALKRVIQYLFEECDIHVIEAKAHVDNIGSYRAMEKAGMAKEAVLKDRKWNKESQTYSDLFVYSVIKNR